MQPYRLFTIFIILLFVTGCAMEGIRHVSVIDNYKKDINDIVVLPLYSSSFGIGVGPDGNGLWSSPTFFTKPFLFSSREDIMINQIHGRGIIIPPLLFIGTSKNINQWLFIKTGYAPLVVSRQIIFNEEPIVMSQSEFGDRKKYIDILLSENPDQTSLKEIFNSINLKENIMVENDKRAIKLLKANY